MSTKILPNEIFVKQEFFFIIDTPREFKILSLDEKILFELKEEIDFSIWQLLFKNKKPFKMRFTYLDKVFTFAKSAKFSSDLLEIIDESDKTIAFLKKDFFKNIEIYKEQEQKLFEIEGSYIKKDFKIKRNDVQLGYITKQFSGLLKEIFTDSDKFYIKFPNNSTLEDQVICIAAAIFIDALYFDE